MQNLPDYLDRIHHSLPALEVRTVSPNQDGLVNEVLIVNEEWVFRFPKDTAGKAALVKEKLLLDRIHPSLDLAVPTYEIFGEEFTRHRLIRGEPLSCSLLLRQPEPVQERVASQLGAFLRQLHTLPETMPPACRLGPPAEPFPPAGSGRTREDWLRFYHRLEEKLYPLLLSNHKRWVREHFQPVLEGSLEFNAPNALVHGDLGAYHILYDREGGCLTGVIDFGTAGLGDPADDFANLIYYLGETFLHKMEKDYPQITAAIDRARFWAGTLELQWALNGLETGDLSWLVNHLGSARDVQPIGT